MYLLGSLVVLSHRQISSCIAMIPGRLLVMWPIHIWKKFWDIKSPNGMQRRW